MELQAMTCLDSLLNRANHDEYLQRIGKKEALRFLEENSKYADIIKSNLHRLESIDNSTPSEALKCFENMQYRIASNISTIEYTTIKQALLKTQEPKQYLKWEDLEFTRDEKVMLVKMGDTVYKVLYRCCDGDKEVQLLSEDEKLLCLLLIGKYKDNIQFFNDLHLERVEE